MKRQMFLNGIFSFVILVSIGCSQPVVEPGGPDLVPERRTNSQGREGFCRIDGSNLIVRVRNQSNADTVMDSTTIVTFSPGGPRSGTSGPMAGGASFDVPIQIPSECFSSDCRFKIQVDANDVINENREDNNVADGICIG